MEMREFHRFYSLDIAKFAFTLMIAVFHFWASYDKNARGGFIAVEFFFILSGFMLMKQYEEQKNEITPGQFVFARVKKYYPHYIFSFVLLFLSKNLLIGRASITELIYHLVGQGAEIFMLHGTILSDEKTYIYNSATWYLSILLVVGYVLWALLKRHREALFTASPVVIFWIYAYMAYTLKSTNNWRTHVFSIFNYAILRGIAGMLLGVMTWYWYCLLKDKNTRGGRYLCLGVVVLLVAFAASYMWFQQSSFFYIILFAIGVVMLSAGEWLCTPQLPKLVQKAASWLSKISWGIYLNHYLIRSAIRHFFPNYHNWLLPYYLVILIVYSIFTSIVVRRITQVFSRHRKRR